MKPDVQMDLVECGGKQAVRAYFGIVDSEGRTHHGCMIRPCNQDDPASVADAKAEMMVLINDEAERVGRMTCRQFREHAQSLGGAADVDHERELAQLGR